MTAFGLAVAIPAVLGYNALSRANRALGSQLRRFARQLSGYFLTGDSLDATREGRVAGASHGGTLHAVGRTGPAGRKDKDSPSAFAAAEG